MVVNTHRKAINLAHEVVTDWSKEHAIGIYLTAKLHLIRCEVISIGTLSTNLMHPREVFKPAFISSAASVIVLHNHPSEILTPSKADKAIASKLFAAGSILDIPLGDYIIFDIHKRYYSFAERGEVK